MAWGIRLLLATHKSVVSALLLAGAALLAAKPAAGADSAALPSTLEAGYRQMYNLDFDGAHATFQAWETGHPDDAVGPMSNAAAYLFSEFNRLHILESELFTDNEKFAKREKLVPDPQVRAAFDRELAKGDEIAGRVLSGSPQDANALFAKVMASGLRGDYAAMIEKRNMAGLGYMKAGRAAGPEAAHARSLVLRRLSRGRHRELPAQREFRAGPLAAAHRRGGDQ